MKFLELAKKILEEEKRPLSANEIWKLAEDRGYTKQLKTQGITPWDTLNAQLYTKIKNYNSEISAIGNRPKKFFLKEINNGLPVVDITLSDSSFSEADLHPLLTYFAKTNFNCYTKTIDEKKSIRSGINNQWLHPDIVGCQFPFIEFENNVIDLLGQFKIEKGILYSFELKKELTQSNIRESFFQCVSNSSWANISYLVAADIQDDVEFRNELNRLSVSFGIGIIELDVNDPEDAKVLFQAKQKDILDWQTVNKLCKQNRDFAEFLNTVKEESSVSRINKDRYDKIFDREVLMKKFSKEPILT